MNISRPLARSRCPGGAAPAPQECGLWRSRWLPCHHHYPLNLGIEDRQYGTIVAMLLNVPSVNCHICRGS